MLWRESESTVAVEESVRVQGGVECKAIAFCFPPFARLEAKNQLTNRFITLYRLDAIVEQPVWIPTVRIDTHKPNAKTGIGWCDFNCDGTLLASRNGMSDS